MKLSDLYAVQRYQRTIEELQERKTKVSDTPDFAFGFFRKINGRAHTHPELWLEGAEASMLRECLIQWYDASISNTKKAIRELGVDPDA